MRKAAIILRTFSWRLDLGDKDTQLVMDTMRDLASRLIRVQPVLRGLKLEPIGPQKLYVQMRVAGHTRWEIQRDARKLIIKFLRRVFITPAAIELEQVVTERNGSDLYLGEGRTPMRKPPRAATKPDGTPWDHYEWWGDQLPTPASTTDPVARDAAEDPDGQPRPPASQ